MKYHIEWWGGHTETVNQERYEWFLNRGHHQFDVLEEIDEADEPQQLDEFLSGLSIQGDVPCDEQVAQFDQIMKRMKQKGGVA